MFFDYDNDRRPDIFLVNSRPWKGEGSPVTGKLYRNDGGGKFSDVTAGSGLDIEIYGLGAAAGDYDNDGFVDLYVTVLDGDRLFRNRGDGTFADVTRAAGIDNARFGTSAAWLDFDLDGLLDIFVANYVEWSIDKDLWCTLDGANKTYCTPESYKGQPAALYRNLGDGTFADVSEQAGIADPTAKALGIAVSTTTATACPTFSKPTTRSPTSSTATKATGLSASTDSPPESLSGRTARRGERWESMPPTTTAAGGRICWWAISPTKCSISSTTKATGFSWTRRRPAPSAPAACSR